MLVNVPKRLRAKTIAQAVRLNVTLETRAEKVITPALQKVAEAAATAYLTGGGHSARLVAMQTAPVLRAALVRVYHQTATVWHGVVLPSLRPHKYSYLPARPVGGNAWDDDKLPAVLSPPGSPVGTTPLDLSNPEGIYTNALQAWITTESAKQVTNVTQTIVHDIADAVEEGFKNGDGPTTIANSIQALVGSRNRADLIARTETHNASTKAVDETVRAYAPQARKEWASTEDDRVRPSHAEADGQVVDLDDDFRVGEAEMDRPGGDGPPEEVCNCRCVVLYWTALSAGQDDDDGA